MNQDFRRPGLEKITGTSTREALLERIRWLARSCLQQPVEAVPWRLLTRAVLATGPALQAALGFPEQHPTARTLRAAEDFVLQPTSRAETASLSEDFLTQGCARPAARLLDPSASAFRPGGWHTS